MSKKQKKPLLRSFSLIVFLVLAVGMLTMLSYLNHKNSEELTHTVEDLRHNRYEIDRIDQAIQLLYKAENNSRAFVLTWDPAFQNLYLEQLLEVSNLVDSIQGGNQNKDLGNLVSNKREKTEIFIQARQLADSLLKLNATEERGPVKTITQRVESTVEQNTPQEDKKVVDESVVKKKNKKRLFARIAEAIANKPKETNVQKVTVYEQARRDSLARIEETTITVDAGPEININPAFATLSDKEKELLEANRILFSKLQSILVNLKIGEQQLFDQRQQRLSDNASQVISRLKSDHNYILLFSIILTLIILIILGKLFKNHRDLQKARDEAEAHARYKSEFVALLSHEIRTPLQSVQAYSNTLSLEQSKDEQASNIEAIKLSAHTLLAIINNILDFSKMEKGKFKLNHAPFNPSIVIKEVTTALEIQARQKQLALKSQIDDSLNQALYGDAFYFRQLLINLVSNAIKYTRAGEVSIKARFKLEDSIKGHVYLEVRDTGVGIAPEALPHLFEAYSAQEHIDEVKEGSTGLGLSVVKKVVDFHQGTIDVESQPGVGTVFHLCLPYDIYLSSLDTNTPSVKETGSLRKLLINENDRLTSRYLEMLLKDDNYVLTMTQSGEEAFKQVRENEFDLIITDISMPGMSGQDLLEKIRGLSDSHKSNIPIIALTGYEPPEEGEAPVFDAWITKPFNADILVSRIEELCQLDRNEPHIQRNN